MRLALALHLLAAVLWIGGMAFAVLALRPALATLTPAQRLGVMAAVLARFLPAVGAAIVVLVASGIVLLRVHGGLAAAPPGVHVMIALGLVMIAIYLYLALGVFPRLRAGVAAAEWAAAATLAERTRRWIVVNVVLGVLVVVAAAAARFA
jgi:uncharacterized membrane protein